MSLPSGALCCYPDVAVSTLADVVPSVANDNPKESGAVASLVGCLSMRSVSRLVLVRLHTDVL